ncbi:alpha/beta hydrolase, partial [Salmonella enterica subsp. enterica serovar Infantis]
DPRREEGDALAHRRHDLGGACTCQRYLGGIHGFFQLGGGSQAARSARRDVAWRVVSPSTGKMT